MCQWPVIKRDSRFPGRISKNGCWLSGVLAYVLEVLNSQIESMDCTVQKEIKLHDNEA